MSSGSYYYQKAFTDLDDPYWACHYAVTTHPLYGLCVLCPHLGNCDMQPISLDSVGGLSVDITVKITITDDD